MQPAASKALGPVRVRNWEGIAGGTQGDSNGMGASAQRVVWCWWSHRSRMGMQKGQEMWGLMRSPLHSQLRFCIKGQLHVSPLIPSCPPLPFPRQGVFFPLLSTFCQQMGETCALRGPRATAALCAPLPSISAAAAENSTVLLLPFGSSPCLLVEVGGRGAEPLHKGGVLTVLDGMGDPHELVMLMGIRGLLVWLPERTMGPRLLLLCGAPMWSSVCGFLPRPCAGQAAASSRACHRGWVSP